MRLLRSKDGPYLHTDTGARIYHLRFFEDRYEMLDQAMRVLETHGPMTEAYIDAWLKDGALKYWEEVVLDPDLALVEGL